MTVLKKEITARIFRIESLNTHNGPGYRTVVYFKGCPLNCQWCHNPESISPKREIWVIHKNCIGCETCTRVCPSNALSMTNGGIIVDRNKCTGCYQCAEECPSKAIEKLGEDLTVDRLFKRILDDKPFMDASDGGVTLTGGEPGSFPDFAEAFLRKCEENGIHTAFDTSGYVSKKALQKILPFVDLIFFDLKVMDEKRAKKLTGQNTLKILDALHFIKEHIQINGKPELEFRTPIIPGSTDDSENLNTISVLLKKDFQGQFRKWELCLFNDICEDKYQRMNRDWKYKNKDYKALDLDRIRQFQKINKDLHVEISGFVSK